MINTKNQYERLLPGVPLVESPFFNDFCEDVWSGDYLRIARDLNKYGFAKFSLIDHFSHFHSHTQGIIKDYHPKYDWQAWRNGEIDSLRIQDAWRDDFRVKEIATAPYILDLLSSIYGRNVIPFQTLNFPVGTQQGSHSDHVHFSSLPEKFMCGVWVPFEKVDDDNGPLFYYPKSHKWPCYGNEHIGVSGSKIINSYDHYPKYVELWEAIAKSQNIEKERFNTEPGEALIWASNLVHGGTPMLDKSRTRWSQVTHYFFEGCGYTTPVANDINLGQIYYREIENISTNEITPNVISGVHVSDATVQRLKPPSLAKATLPKDFDPVKYLLLNPDVKKAGADPITHYINFGRLEGRSFK